jgi:enoyl-CoA hydratase/carnithine racemase
MGDDPVLLEVKRGVAVITLNRPARHNAIGDAMDALLFRYLDLLRNDRDVRVVLWQGAGPSFSVGRDMAELAGDESDVGPGLTPPRGTARVPGYVGSGSRSGGDDAPAEGRRSSDHEPAVAPPGEVAAGLASRSARAQSGFGPSEFEVLDRSRWGARMLADFPVPVVCALKGWTLGRAFERALLCDVRIAGESTRVSLSGIDHGLLPDSGGLAKLYEIGGSGLALDLALTGRRVGADEALRLGLVSRVVPDGEVDEVAHQLALDIAEKPPLVTRMLREHVQALAEPGVRGTLGRELTAQTLVLASHDFGEQHRARTEDREPRYERR